MPRTVSTSFRRATEQPASGVVALVFLEIDHAKLAEPIRLVSDQVDYIWQGKRWLGGMPFEAELLSDEEGPPRAKLRVQNIDQRIGEVVLAIDSPPTIEASVLADDAH
jgi:hypothetical protein